MILGIMGTPGAFKTAYVVQEQIVKFLRDGRHIYTNIKGINPYNISILFNLDPFDCESHIHYLGRVYDDLESSSYHEDIEKIRHFHHNLPTGSVVIIDEAQDYFGCREFKSDFSKDLIPWLSKCRHENYDVIWITPNFDNVDITFRRTSHMFYKMFRLEHLGVLLKNTSKISKWSTMDLDKKPLASSFFSPKKIVFDCYDSYDVKGDVKENRERHNVFLRSPFVWFMLICLGWALWTVMSGNFERTVMKKKDVKKKETIEQVEKEIIENKNEVKIDGKCISKISKIRGQAIYYFNDGSSSINASGFSICPN